MTLTFNQNRKYGYPLVWDIGIDTARIKLNVGFEILKFTSLLFGIAPICIPSKRYDDGHRSFKIYLGLLVLTFYYTNKHKQEDYFVMLRRLDQVDEVFPNGE